MAYNRYRGSSGRRVRVETPEDRTLPPIPARTGGSPAGALSPGPRRGGPEELLSRLGLAAPGEEDWLVLGILWLLYRASGDPELLLAMGAYLFL